MKLSQVFPGWKEEQSKDQQEPEAAGWARQPPHAAWCHTISSCFQAESGCLGLKQVLQQLKDKLRWWGMRQHGKAERGTMVCMNIFADPGLCNSPSIMWPHPFSVCSNALKLACFRWPQASCAAPPPRHTHTHACHTSVFSVWGLEILIYVFTWLCNL